MDDIDPPLLRFAAEHVEPGMTVWDVGANVGLFSFAAALRTGQRGKVYAFEPDAWLVQLLRRSARAQVPDAAPVEIVPGAIGGEVGLRTFCLAQRSRAANFLGGHGSSQTGGVREEQTVICLTIDWLAARITPPAVLKIDVEGAEVEVLNGARRTLTENRPKVLCEVTGENAKAVSQLLNELGYVLYDGSSPGSPAVTTATWNTVALPGPR
jgi:FkbM family methyltransferase